MTDDTGERVPDDFIAGNFVKLYGSIVTSSVWVEPDHVFRVWILFLALADSKGRVVGTVPGLANIARVSIENFVEAIERFMAPDPYSRSKNDEGRRIVEIEGGWRIINHEKYRELRTEKQVRDAERQAKHRDRLRDGRDTSQESQEVATEAEGEAEADTEAPPTKETAEEADVRLRQVLKALGVGRHLSWAQMLLGMRQGLGAPGMKALPWDTLLEAAQELAAVGGDVTPSRYKAFVGKVLNRKDREADGGPQYSTRAGPSTKKRKGYTLLASKLIQKVRALRNPQFPTSLAAGWREQLDQEPVGDGKLAQFVQDFGISRFLAETKDDGTLTAQLAKAMEEAEL